MRLDRYDAMATAATALAGAAYVAHVNDVAPLASARVTAVALLAPGLVACATNGSRPGYSATGTFGSVMTLFGVLALALGIAVLATGAEDTLTGLAFLIGLLWAATTVRHLLVAPAPAQPAPDEARTPVGVR